MSHHYHPGQRIRCRGEEWQVTRADLHRIANGGEVWEVRAMGLTRIVQGFEFCFLSDLDAIEVIDPTDIEPVLASASRAKLFWEANLRRLLPRNGAIYLGQHGAVRPYEYQLHPASLALNMVRPRLLIGDAVGLGKTIECGILLSELIRRGRAKRVLCAVPKAILEQFQIEMWARFSIPFHRLDSLGLERLRQELPSTMNPFFHFDKAIISVDTLKLKKYQKLLEDCQWDVLVIDECHNVADRTDGGGGSARHRVARRLADKANAVILMSATPHDGTKPGFASLIKLLDRTKIRHDENYQPADFKEHFIRRSRSDVASQLDHREKRLQRIEKIPLSVAETDLLQALHDAEMRSSLMAQRSNHGSRELFKTTLIKSLLSSPRALKQTVIEKRNRIQKSLEEGKRKPDLDTEKFINLLEDIEAAVQKLPTFSRLDYLGKYLRKNPTTPDNRLVIFTERLLTLDAIKEYLLKMGLVDGEFDPKSEEVQAQGKLLATAQGSMSDVELNRIVKAFQTKNNGLHILVATNVASEGLNLHKNCHRLIHFDLPWSLITLEQRNGRIDRLGQEKQPQIFYFASVADHDSRETKVHKLKDDFWIIDKIQKRIEVASSDLAEDSLSQFVDGSVEEAANTSAYEANQPALVSEDPLTALLLGADTAKNYLGNSDCTRKGLATLYQRSPADFISGVCKEAGIEIAEKDSQQVTLSLTKSLQFEVNNWPREFRPDMDGNTLTLESNAERMQTHYDQMLDLGAYLNQSFMNEIHPAVALLENTAMGFFPGKKVPTVTIKGSDIETVHFLVQGTLFNECNDIVQQYWQIFEHKKGSPRLIPLVQLQDNDHAVKVSNWLNEKLRNIKKKVGLTDRELRRIEGLTGKSASLMAELISECRIGRTKELQPVLNAELKRIKEWEEARKTYLEGIIAYPSTAQHGGVFAFASKARRELETIHADSIAYNKFVQTFLTTSSEPDIRILGCFIVGE